MSAAPRATRRCPAPYSPAATADSDPAPLHGGPSEDASPAPMVDIRCEYLATFGYLAILNVSKTLPGRRSHGVARVLHSITTTCAALLRQNMSALHEGQDPSIVVRMWFAGDNAGVSRRRSGSRCKGAAAVVRVVPGVARRPGPHVGVRGCHSCPHEVRRHPRPIAHVWFAVSHDKLRHAAVNRRFWLRVYCGRAQANGCGSGRKRRAQQ